MKKMKSINQAVLIIGIFGVFAGVLSVVAGQEFHAYFVILIMSLSLIVASFIGAYKRIGDE